MRSVHTVFIGGTASNVGKSWMATAFCRLLHRRGVRVAPFKAQNMSNNSCPCPGGGEIGRSQAAQAAACGIPPEPAMNPVLLKPCGDSQSQVIVHGKVWRTLDAREYYGHVPFLRAEALSAHADLARRFDVIVMEGAGSVAEVNLADRDFANLGLACEVGAKALLVADIEPGGVFASILGTLDLLPPEQRAIVKAFAVNRFRGDPTLFDDGVRILQERSGIPCLGVFPFRPGISLDAEDSLSTPKPRIARGDQPKIAIIRFPRISNTTDFRLLPGAEFIDAPVPGRFDCVILPGTKTTLGDFDWLRGTGLDEWVHEQHVEGATVIGICGGYQMLGEWISDPDGVDGTPGARLGLGLLPVRTKMAGEKTVGNQSARTPGGATFEAYEIHMGRTVPSCPVEPFAVLDDGTPEGARKGRVFGTHLHGALDSPAVIREILDFDPGTQGGTDYDALADWLEATADAGVLDSLLGPG